MDPLEAQRTRIDSLFNRAEALLTKAPAAVRAQANDPEQGVSATKKRWLSGRNKASKEELDFTEAIIKQGVAHIVSTIKGGPPPADLSYSAKIDLSKPAAEAVTVSVSPSMAAKITQKAGIYGGGLQVLMRKPSSVPAFKKGPFRVGDAEVGIEWNPFKALSNLGGRAEKKLERESPAFKKQAETARAAVEKAKSAARAVTSLPGKAAHAAASIPGTVREAQEAMREGKEALDTFGTVKRTLKAAAPYALGGAGILGLTIWYFKFRK